MPTYCQLSKVLEHGLRGFEERVREAKAKLDLTDPASIDKYHFYDSIFIIIDLVKDTQSVLWFWLLN